MNGALWGPGLERPKRMSVSRTEKAWAFWIALVGAFVAWMAIAI